VSRLILARVERTGNIFYPQEERSTEKTAPKNSNSCTEEKREKNGTHHS